MFGEGREWGKSEGMMGRARWRLCEWFGMFDDAGTMRDDADGRQTLWERVYCMVC